MSAPSPGSREARATSQRGALYMMASAAAFASMTAFVKAVGSHIPSQEIVLCRAIISLVLSALWLRRAGVAPFGHKRGLLLLRGFFGFCGLSCVFAAVTRLPLAEATVLQYTHPTFTALLAWLVLRERTGRGVWIASAISLVGVVLIAEPATLMSAIGLGNTATASSLPPAAVALGLGGALFSAAAYVTVRRLSATEHPLVIVLYFPLVTVPATLPLVWNEMVWPSGLEWMGLLGVGLTAQAGQVWLTRGLSVLPAARGTALSYVQVVFAAGIGMAIFHEPVLLTTVVGALLIIGGTASLSLWRR